MVFTIAYEFTFSVITFCFIEVTDSTHGFLCYRCHGWDANSFEVICHARQIYKHVGEYIMIY